MSVGKIFNEEDYAREHLNGSKQHLRHVFLTARTLLFDSF